jgi:uncharacterized membrane protein YdjX (TVP38/TMEM64 family)
LFGPFRVLFNVDFLVEQISWLQQHSCCAEIGFLVIYILLTVIGIPATILTIAGGAVFGLSWGTFWSVIGATFGAIGAFFLARYLCHDFLEGKIEKNPILAKFKKAVNQQPLNFVLVVRFAPIAPFNLINFLFGLTPIHWFPYSLGTFIGIIPGTLVYSWLGVAGEKALRGGDRLPFFLALLLLSLLSCLPFLFKKNN